MPENEYVKIDMSKDVEAEIQFLKEENKRLVDEHERICNESAKRKREIEVLTEEKELLKEIAKDEAMKRIEESNILKDIYNIYDGC